MRIKEATWEKRNLGVTTFEVSVDYDDTVDSLDKIQTLDSEYTVVKISADNQDAVEEIQKMGFRYIEDMIHVEHNLDEVRRDRILQRLYEASSYRRMNEEDYDQLRNEIEAGMFKNDRISRDSYFGVKASAKRYLNWVDDLWKKGALLYSIRYRDENVGFVILDTNDKIIYNSILGGGYEKYRKSGLGIIQKEMEITRSLGGRKLTTAVSSNNPGQVKALVVNGYKPYYIEHVFIKHN